MSSANRISVPSRTMPNRRRCVAGVRPGRHAADPISSERQSPVGLNGMHTSVKLTHSADLRATATLWRPTSYWPQRPACAPSNHREVSRAECRLLISRQRIQLRSVSHARVTGIKRGLATGSKGCGPTRSIRSRVPCATAAAAATTTTVGWITGSASTASAHQTAAGHRTHQKQPGTKHYNTVHESDSKVLPSGIG